MTSIEMAVMAANIRKVTEYNVSTDDIPLNDVFDEFNKMIKQ